MCHTFFFHDRAYKADPLRGRLIIVIADRYVVVASRLNGGGHELCPGLRNRGIIDFGVTILNLSNLDSAQQTKDGEDVVARFGNFCVARLD